MQGESYIRLLSSGLVSVTPTDLIFKDNKPKVKSWAPGNEWY